MPFWSIVKPWVSTALYGAWPRVPQLSSNDDWNQPRCWSVPSRYRSAHGPIWSFWPRQVRPFAAFQNECVGAAAVEPHVENIDNAFVIGGVVIAAQIFCRALIAPCIDADFAYGGDDPFVDGVVAQIWPVLRSTNNVIGTPHARWRLSTQSGRPSTMLLIRLRPFSGTQRVSAMAVTAVSLKVPLPLAGGVRGGEWSASGLPTPTPPAGGRGSRGLSIGTNHCGVQR